MDPLGDKEFSSYKSYKKSLGDKAIAKKDWVGQDGNWLKSDREEGSNRWDGANTANLQKGNFGEYATITERKDFYGWFAVKIDKKGFDNNWPGAAYIVAGQMSMLDNPAIAWWVCKYP